MHAVNHFAYLDAGTGSLIIQSLVGIVAGIGVFGRRMIANAVHKVKGVFGGNDQATTTVTQKDKTASKAK